MGERAIIGLTVKTAQQAQQVPVDLIDYACIGGVYDTLSKDNPTAIGLDGWQAAAAPLRARAPAFPWVLSRASMPQTLQVHRHRSRWCGHHFGYLHAGRCTLGHPDLVQHHPGGTRIDRHRSHYRGSDSGGGAGIQADLKTMSALGVYGATVITAITAQNTLGVTAVHDIPTDIVAAQFDAVCNDLAVDAIKIGMLSSVALVDTVASKLAERPAIPVILDPVMVAESGTPAGGGGGGGHPYTSSRWPPSSRPISISWQNCWGRAWQPPAMP